MSRQLHRVDRRSATPVSTRLGGYEKKWVDDDDATPICGASLADLESRLSVIDKELAEQIEKEKANEQIQ